ncbi:MAG: hypothetical protein AAGC68_17945, partial [Verrucomicrobiota bacterium]
RNRWKVRLVRSLPPSGFRLAKMGQEEPLREMLRWYLRWEPSVDWSLFERRHDAPWESFAIRFSPSEAKSVTDKEGQLALARAWLESEWEYDAATMTFRTRP